MSLAKKVRTTNYSRLPTLIRLLLSTALVCAASADSGKIGPSENLSPSFFKTHSAQIRSRLNHSMRKARTPYPPSAVRLAVFKKEQKVELWLPDIDRRWRYVKEYKFTASSGKQGPKIYYGDLQIPEGIYGVDSMGPSKEYHFALHLDYPNAFDRAMRELEGRDADYVSTGINVHGGAISYGCVVVGDRNIEEIYLLVRAAKKQNAHVYIFPHDGDRESLKFKSCEGCPIWYGELTRKLERVLPEFKR